MDLKVNAGSTELGLSAGGGCEQRVMKCFFAAQKVNSIREGNRLLLYSLSLYSRYTLGNDGANNARENRAMNRQNRPETN